MCKSKQNIEVVTKIVLIFFFNEAGVPNLPNSAIGENFADGSSARVQGRQQMHTAAFCTKQPKEKYCVYVCACAFLLVLTARRAHTLARRGISLLRRLVPLAKLHLPHTSHDTHLSTPSPPASSNSRKRYRKAALKKEFRNNEKNKKKVNSVYSSTFRIT